MRFPETNKIHQNFEESFGMNAQLLEEAMKRAHWRYIIGVYFAGLGIFLVTMFLLIVVVRIALNIF